MVSNGIKHIENQPLISVIVPVYNCEKYLDECVRSIIDQSYYNLEIILVDDGSTDLSLQKCNAFAEIDDRIIVIHKQNGGASSARNCGLKIAAGEYIGFVDSDDYISEDFLTQLLSGFSLFPSIDVVSSLAYRVQGKKITEYGPRRTGLFESENLVRQLLYDNVEHSVCCKLFSRNIIDGVEFKEGSVCEDFLFNYYVFAKMKKQRSSMYIFPQRTYYYRYNEKGVMVGQKKSTIDATLSHLLEIEQDSNKCGLTFESELAYGRFVSTLIAFFEHMQDNPSLRNRYYSIWRPYIRKISVRCIIGKWGIRHILLFLVMKYCPLLWNIRLVKDFCSKCSGLPPFVQIEKID